MATKTVPPHEISNARYRAVASGQVKVLTQDEKDSLQPSHLIALIGSGLLRRNQQDKDRLKTQQLTGLALGGLMRLSKTDLARLTEKQRRALEGAGVA